MKAEDYYKEKHGDSEWLNKAEILKLMKDYSDYRFELFRNQQAKFKLDQFNQQLRGDDRKDCGGKP